MFFKRCFEYQEIVKSCYVWNKIKVYRPLIWHKLVLNAGLNSALHQLSYHRKSLQFVRCQIIYILNKIFSYPLILKKSRLMGSIGWGKSPPFIHGFVSWGFVLLGVTQSSSEPWCSFKKEQRFVLKKNLVLWTKTQSLIATNLCFVL